MPKGTGGSFTTFRRISSAKANEFSVIKQFNLGYRNREDQTNLPPQTLVTGSQNVLTNVSGRVGIRKGYTLDGGASTNGLGIYSAYDYELHNGTIQHLRAGFLSSAGNDGALQIRAIDGNGVTKWVDLLTSLSSVKFNFTEYFDTTHSQSLLLFVNGASSITEWTGGVGVIKSVGNNSVSLVGNNALLTSLTAATNITSGFFDLNNLTGTSFEGSLVLGDQNTQIQPANGNTLTLTINATPITITFVSVIGAIPGNVLIGATASATRTNLLGLLQAPGTTNATQVALSGPNQTLVGYVTWAASNTITKTGTTTYAQDGFYTTGTGHSIINGDEGPIYTVVGGWGTTTLFGISPDPLLGSGVHNIIAQLPETTLNSSLTSLPSTLANQLIANLRNQIYVASLSNQNVYVSKANNYKDYSFTTPVRVVGEGAVVTLDGRPQALIPQEDQMYMSAGQDQWYLTKFTLSADLTKEAFDISRLKTTTQQASQSQALTTKIGNDIAFVSFEPILQSLGRVDNVVLTPQLSDLSHAIVNDMNSYDFTDGQVFYYRKFVYVSIPKSSIVRVYNMTDPKNPYWEAPLILPIGKFSIINGDLYGHSYLTSETYKLFNGTNDNGNFINAIAKFAFNQFGERPTSKGFTQYYTEGYISSNTTLNLGLQYDIDGCATITSRSILGTDSKIVCLPSDSSSLGKDELGKNPLGGTINQVSALPPKFRVVKTMNKIPFYEYQPSFSSNGIDQQWEIIAFGPASSSTAEGNNAITE